MAANAGLRHPVFGNRMVPPAMKLHRAPGTPDPAILNRCLRYFRSFYRLEYSAAAAFRISPFQP